MLISGWGAPGICNPVGTAGLDAAVWAGVPPIENLNAGNPVDWGAGWGACGAPRVGVAGVFVCASAVVESGLSNQDASVCLRLTKPGETCPPALLYSNSFCCAVA